VDDDPEAVLIDLSVSPAEDEHPPRPVRRPGRITAVAVLLITVVSLGGGTPPVVAAVRGPIQLSTDAGTVLPGTDTVYVATAGHGIRAFDADTGRLTWASQLPDGTMDHITELATTTLVTMETPEGITTTALDRDTGATRWHRDGAPIWRSPDGARVVLDPQVPSDAEPTALTCVATADGRDIWAYSGERRPAGRARWAIGFESGTLAMVGVLVTPPAGDAQVFDFATGEFRTLPESTHGWFTVVDDLLITDSEDYGVLQAYDRRTLHPLWTSTGLAGVPRNSARYGMRCGRLVCLATGDAAATVALDPVTGAARWAVSWDVLPGNGGYVLGFRQSGGDSGTLAVLEGTTGATLLELENQQPLISELPRARIPLLQQGTSNRPQLTVLDVDHLTMAPVTEFGGGSRAGQDAETAPDAASSCRASRTIITCVAGTGTVRVWRYADDR